MTLCIICIGRESAPPAATVAAAKTAAIKEQINPKDGADMVFVPAGEFLMGSEEGQGSEGERPQRKVTLDDYYIYKFEVTVAQYRQFCAVTQRAMPPAPPWKWQDAHPIVNVTWFDASAYAAWAGAALPTEAQWEKAARGTDGRAFVSGNNFTKSTCHTSDGKTVAVGLFPMAQAATERWIWPAMCGNGARIGMTRIITPRRPRPTLLGGRGHLEGIARWQLGF